ncbi:hypothetical protein RRG08_064875 [Elysia crispata]|uniref:Uncharacterized protein n=1 Tax=Elysia crispata TaxID=231223 RepID=A0AAE1CIY3_9GAST|nr:hypothetical protein RRG08_064875 [Elysia crispata]
MAMRQFSPGAASVSYDDSVAIPGDGESDFPWRPHYQPVELSPSISGCYHKQCLLRVGSSSYEAITRREIS